MHGSKCFVAAPFGLFAGFLRRSHKTFTSRRRQVRYGTARTAHDHRRCRGAGHRLYRPCWGRRGRRGGQSRDGHDARFRGVARLRRRDGSRRRRPGWRRTVDTVYREGGSGGHCGFDGLSLVGTVRDSSRQPTPRLGSLLDRLPYVEYPRPTVPVGSTVPKIPPNTAD